MPVAKTPAEHRADMERASRAIIKKNATVQHLDDLLIGLDNFALTSDDATDDSALSDAWMTRESS